jgi:hypothetical protein
LLVKECKRTSLTLSPSIYTSLTSTIKDRISNLESVTSMNIELEPRRRVKSQGKVLQILRSLSTSVFQAIKSSLACACKHRSFINLPYSLHGRTPIDCEDNAIQKVDVYLDLSFDQDHPRASQTSAQANRSGMSSS